jgi:hypothetical protein
MAKNWSPLPPISPKCFSTWGFDVPRQFLPDPDDSVALRVQAGGFQVQGHVAAIHTNCPPGFAGARILPRLGIHCKAGSAVGPS